MILPSRSVFTDELCSRRSSAEFGVVRFEGQTPGLEATVRVLYTDVQICYKYIYRIAG